MKAFRILLGLTAGWLSQAHAERLPVLIIDGQNNHNWKSTTPVLQKSLESSGRFSVEVFSATSGEAFSLLLSPAKEGRNF